MVQQEFEVACEDVSGLAEEIHSIHHYKLLSQNVGNEICRSRST